MATYQLRAMSFGEILDGAFAIYRRYFGVLVGVAVTCTGIPAILNIYVTTVGLSVSPGTLILWLVLYAVGGLVAAGATIYAISEAFLGVEPNLGDALRFALGKIAKIFLAGLAKYIMIGLVWLVSVMLGGVIVAVAGSLLWSFLGILVAMIGTGVVASGLAIVTQAAVLEEETSATDALRRSWTLTNGFKWKALGLGVVLWLLLALPLLAAGALAEFVPSLQIVIRSAAALLQLIVYPVFASAFTLLYYDLRVRKEAFDLEYLGRQLGIESLGP